MSNVLHVDRAGLSSGESISPPRIAEYLNSIVAGSYALMFKSQVVHWNVKGPLFYSLHELTETQYNDLFNAIDNLAERVRALGSSAPSDLTQMMANTQLKSSLAATDAQGMIADLVRDHRNLAEFLQSVIRACEREGDSPTADMLTERRLFHEKAAWMLESLGTA